MRENRTPGSVRGAPRKGRSYRDGRKDRLAMEFVPAGEFIGEEHQVRTVGLRDSRQLPDGDYRFVDTYCTDPTCDCRKTMIIVYRNDVHVSTINFGREAVNVKKVVASMKPFFPFLRSEFCLK